MYKAFTTLITLTALILLSSCSEIAYFSEYRNINYLDALTFDAGPAGSEINWVPDDISDTYMTFTSILTPPTTNGLPASASDFSRLEILNLIPDGGFKDGTGDWMPVLGGTVLHQPGDGFTINPTNHSLQFTINSTQRIEYDLEKLPGIIDNGEYLIKLNFNKNITGNAVFEHNNGLELSYESYDYWNPSISSNWADNNNDPFSALLSIKSGAGNDYFSIGSKIHGESQLGHIDDVRFIRSDIPLSIKSEIQYTDVGRPEFISGNYRFSIYILKEDINDIQPINPLRFASEYVTLSINNNTAAIDVSSVTSGTWIKISTEQFIQIYENDTISLSISPCDITSPYNKDSGSILISSPELEYLSK